MGANIVSIGTAGVKEGAEEGAVLGEFAEPAHRDPMLSHPSSDSYQRRKAELSSMTQPWQAEGPREAESSHPAEAAAGTFRARRMISGKRVLPPALIRSQIPATLQISGFSEKSSQTPGHLLGARVAYCPSQISG